MQILVSIQCFVSKTKLFYISDVSNKRDSKLSHNGFFFSFLNFKLNNTLASLKAKKRKRMILMVEPTIFRVQFYGCHNWCGRLVGQMVSAQDCGSGGP